MRATAIIAAGGSGRRFGGSTKKQFISILGKPVLAWTLRPFLLSEAVTYIIMVVPEEDIEFCRNEILPVLNPAKRIRVTGGGETRQMSVQNGLRLVARETDFVVVHDGARPFIGTHAIENGLAECARHGAVIFAVPETETVVEVEGGRISSFLDRECIWRVQTPQIFSYDIIMRAFRCAEESGLEATDESALVRNAGFGVRVLRGTYDNIKITVPEDIDKAEVILKKREDVTVRSEKAAPPEGLLMGGGTE